MENAAELHPYLGGVGNVARQHHVHLHMQRLECASDGAANDLRVAESSHLCRQLHELGERVRFQRERKFIAILAD